MPGRWRTQTTNLQSIVVEACWRPMEGDLAGDFHDVIDLKDGRVVVVVGDAPGFGPRAAELAEDLRSEIRHAFRHTDHPPEVLRRLDDRLREASDEAIATVACAVIDPRSRTVDVANAGHPPILLADRTEVQFLNGGGDPPVGVPAERRLVSHALPSEAALFLYTDGLIERRGASLDDALTALVEVSRGVIATPAWASELARRATERFGQPADDATVLSVRVLLNGVRPAPLVAAEQQHVRLRVYIDPRDLRSTQTEAVVNELASRLRRHRDVHVEVVDVTAPGPLTETDRVLAVPTVAKITPEPPVQVIGGLRSAVELARALQLPLPEEDE